MAYEIYALTSIEARSFAFGVQSLNHWTTQEVLGVVSGNLDIVPFIGPAPRMSTPRTIPTLQSTGGISLEK